jgi:hypothetical protein
MTVFKANFVTGMFVGLTLAIAAPLTGTELVATLSAPASADNAAIQGPDASLQTVNRAAKSDRLHLPQNAIGNSQSKMPKIPEGCDPAFSPLSRGAASNFTSRCLS